MRGHFTVLVLASVASPAFADTALDVNALALASPSPAPSPACAFADRWPQLPSEQEMPHYLTLEDQITDHLTDFGNEVGGHLHRLSFQLVGLQVDGRARTAHLHIGRTDHYLTFNVDGDIHFADGMARVKARLDLGVAGHEVHVQIPDFEMVPESFNGDRYVEVRVPILERNW